MRVISKKIVREDIVSRLPGVVPSIMDSWSIPPLYKCGVNGENEIFYSRKDAEERASESMSVTSSIITPSTTHNGFEEP